MATLEVDLLESRRPVRRRNLIKFYLAGVVTIILVSIILIFPSQYSPTHTEMIERTDRHPHFVRESKHSRTLVNAILKAANQKRMDFFSLLAQTTAKLNQSLQFIQIGACDWKGDALTGLINQTHLIGIVIEPVDRNFREIHRKMKYIPNAYERILPIQCAMGKESGQRTFYYVNEQYEIDNPKAPHWVKHQINGFKPPPVPKKYISTKNIPVFTPEKVWSMGHRQFQSRWKGEFDLVFIDVEGFDAKVVNSFIDAGFRPQIFMYEQKIVRRKNMSELTVLHAKLREVGYAVLRRGADDIAVYVG